MKKRRIMTALALAALVLTAMPSAAEEAAVTVQEEPAPAPAPETPAPAPETPAPTPETPAPTPETPAPTPETPAPTPETPAPAPETSAPIPEAPAPAPETSAPETAAPEAAPETTAPETSAPAASASGKPASAPAVQSSDGTVTDTSTDNHSVAIPKDPEEKKLKQKVVDAGERKDGYAVSINGGESVQIEPDKSFREVVDAVTGGSYGYKMDYVRPHTGLREPIDIEQEDSIGTIFQKVSVMTGSECEVVLYIRNGNTLWLNMKVQGDLENKDAEILFTSVPDAKACTITYDACGGSLTDSISSIRREGELYSYFDVKASKEGLYFCGWYDGEGEDAGRVFPTDKVTGDITLYAHYSEYEVEVVAFDFGFVTESENSSLVHHIIYPKKEDGTFDVTVYPVIEREGMEFAGWMDESGNPAELTGLSGSRRLTAQWK